MKMIEELIEEMSIYEIEYLATGHISIVPKDIGEILLERFKDEYKLLKVHKWQKK